MTANRFVICDIEATGLHEDKEIIEVALIILQDDKVVEVFETLINPLQSLSDYIQDLTTISTRELTQAPKFYEVADAIRMRLEGATFVSHNTEFDLGLLIKKYTEMGQELKVKSFCTLKVAQHEIPGLKNYNLDALCSFFGIKIKERHRAIGDARATMELFRELQNLRLRVHPKIHFLPHHEKAFKDIPAKAGLLQFKNAEGRVLRYEVTFNMEKTARSLLEVRPENRELLLDTEMVVGEATGSALIAEFRKLLLRPSRFHWMIEVFEEKGEKNFKVSRFRKGLPGLWYFEEYIDARRKLKALGRCLKGESFVYREGGKSKEEIVRHNYKLSELCKEAKFPNDNLIIIGEGRTMGEKSLVLIRRGHVVGYGLAEASEEEILENPDLYLTRRFFQHVGADVAAKYYLRVLKNVSNKNEGWRSLSDHAKL